MSGLSMFLKDQRKKSENALVQVFEKRADVYEALAEEAKRVSALRNGMVVSKNFAEYIKGSGVSKDVIIKTGDVHRFYPDAMDVLTRNTTKPRVLQNS